MENAAGFGVLLLIGLFPIFCSIKNYDWFFEHRKSRFIVKLIGRKCARIFYVLLGFAVIFCGFMGMYADRVF